MHILMVMILKKRKNKIGLLVVLWSLYTDWRRLDPSSLVLWHPYPEVWSEYGRPRGKPSKHPDLPNPLGLGRKFFSEEISQQKKFPPNYLLRLSAPTHSCPHSPSLTSTSLSLHIVAVVDYTATKDVHTFSLKIIIALSSLCFRFRLFCKSVCMCVIEALGCESRRPTNG